MKAAHELLDTAGVPYAGTLDARIARLINERDAATKALGEIERVTDGVERGEPFGDEEVGTMDPLSYVGDVARGALRP